MTVEDDSIVMQEDKEIPGSITIKSMKKTRSEENLHRIEDILLEMSFNGKNEDSNSSDKEIFAGIDPLRQKILYKYFFKKIYNRYFDEGASQLKQSMPMRSRRISMRLNRRFSFDRNYDDSWESSYNSDYENKYNPLSGSNGFAWQRSIVKGKIKNKSNEKFTHPFVTTAGFRKTFGFHFPEDLLMQGQYKFSY